MLFFAITAVFLVAGFGLGFALAPVRAALALGGVWTALAAAQVVIEDTDSREPLPAPHRVMMVTMWFGPAGIGLFAGALLRHERRRSQSRSVMETAEG